MTERKRLLNEILPTPTHNTAHQVGPRARTLSHLKKLATGVAAAALYGSCGFGVVDPLPPPSRCPEVVQQLAALASFVQVNNQLLIELRLFPQANDIVLTESAFVLAGGATIQSTTLDTNTGELVILLTPPAQAAQLVVSIDASCLGEFGRFEVTLDAPAQGNAGDPIPTTIAAPQN